MWACLTRTKPQDKINLLTIRMPSHMYKINFIASLFRVMFRFEKSCDLISWEFFGPHIQEFPYTGFALGN